MPHHVLVPPVTEAQVRDLRVEDTVTLEGTLFGIRDANQIALFDRNRVTRFDMRGHAAIHTAPNVRKVEPSAEHPTGYAPCLRRDHDLRPHGALYRAADATGGRAPHRGQGRIG
jgi:tartrate dehydratase beta subunit/fumarate hydratase class I family protein